MRRHAKASPLIIAARKGTALFSRAGLGAACLCVLGLAAFFGSSAPAAFAEAPTASIDPAGAVTYTTADVSGTVDPKDVETYFYFETQLEGGGWAFAGPLSPIVAGAGPTPVSFQLQGLTPGKEYEVRLVASNSIDPEAISAVETFETETVDPPVVSANDADAVTAFTAHFSGTVEVANADPAFNAACQFDYLTQAAYDANGGTFSEDGSTSANCQPDIVLGSKPQPVHVQVAISQLEPNTQYRFRIRASNLGGTSTAEAPATFTTPAVAPILTEPRHYVLGNGSVALASSLTPRNSAIATCQFSYGPTLSYGQTVPCESLPPADNKAHVVRAELTGLTPGATYHYKVSVTGAGGDAESGDSTFFVATPFDGTACPNEGSPGVGFMPDCRAWELVSPPDKDGYDISPASWSVRVADDGGAVSFMSLGAFGDTNGSTAWGVEYMAQRGASSWATHAITPKVTAPVFPGTNASGWFPGYMGEFSSDLTEGVYLFSHSITSEDPNVGAVSNLYRRDDLRTPGSGDYQLLSQCPSCSSPLPAEEPFESEPMGLAFAGASDDFSHIIFESGDNLTGQTIGDEPKLYEWLSATEQIRLVGILPDGECGSPPCVSNEGALAGSGAGGTSARSGSLTGSPRYRTINNAISDDGSRIFFTTPPYSVPSPIRAVHGELYYRDNGSVTTRVNVSERTDCAEEEPCDGDLVPDPLGHAPAAFMAASGDGSYVYFLSSEKLTDDDGAGLYRADLDQPAGSRLELIAANAQSVPGISQDGDVVYYLAPLEGREYGLYVWKDGVSRLIAEHYKNAATDGFTQQLGEYGPSQHIVISGENGFRVTEDGQHIVFVSSFPANADAVGYDNTHAPGARCDIGRGKKERCMMVFAYDLQSDELRCISCNPTGAPPLNDATINVTKLAGPTIKRPDNPNHAVTEDGARVFFSSADPLVPKDQNGRYDVYQYDAESGNLALLTSGAGNADAFFMNAAPDGSSVFFTTRERLVGWDTDENIDFYAARTYGGFPEPPRPPESCQGDACQPPPTALNDQTPSSVSFTGPGNQVERRARGACPRGKRLKSRNGKQRCVKKRKAKSHKADRRHTGSNRMAGR